MVHVALSSCGNAPCSSSNHVHYASHAQKPTRARRRQGPSIIPRITNHALMSAPTCPRQRCRVPSSMGRPDSRLVWQDQDPPRPSRRRRWKWRCAVEGEGAARPPPIWGLGRGGDGSSATLSCPELDGVRSRRRPHPDLSCRGGSPSSSPLGRSDSASSFSPAPVEVEVRRRR